MDTSYMSESCFIASETLLFTCSMVDDDIILDSGPSREGRVGSVSCTTEAVVGLK